VTTDKEALTLLLGRCSQGDESAGAAAMHDDGGEGKRVDPKIKNTGGGMG
jgi:hypothetical protein